MVQVVWGIGFQLLGKILSGHLWCLPVMVTNTTSWPNSSGCPGWTSTTRMSLVTLQHNCLASTVTQTVWEYWQRQARWIGTGDISGSQIFLYLKTDYDEALAHAAVRNGKVKCVETLAAQERCDFWNVPNSDGDTPLMMALKKNKIGRRSWDSPQMSSS